MTDSPAPAGNETPTEGDRRHSAGRRGQDEYIDRLAQETGALNDRVTRLTDALLTVSDVQDRQMTLEENLRLGREETKDLADAVGMGIIERQRQLYLRIAAACLATFVITFGTTFVVVYFTWHR